MATSYNVSLQPPPTFYFDKLDEWPKWQTVLCGIGLSKEGNVWQVSTLLYCLGEKDDHILTSTNVTSENRKKCSKILTKFDAHFKVRKNIIFEWARFNRHEQEEGETVKHFIYIAYINFLKTVSMVR